MKVLAICGSLRMKSYNLAILLEIRSRWPKNSEFHLFNRLEEIPPFNPDRTDEVDSLKDLRAQIRRADAILVASPEYVHGIPGVLKNALDWVVGSGEWDGKSTAIIHVTPSANEPQFVRESLAEVLAVMSGRCLLPEASFVVQGAFKKFDLSGRVIDPALSDRIDRTIENLEEAVASRKK